MGALCSLDEFECHRDPCSPGSGALEGDTEFRRRAIPNLNAKQMSAALRQIQLAEEVAWHQFCKSALDWAEGSASRFPDYESLLEQAAAEAALLIEGLGDGTE